MKAPCEFARAGTPSIIETVRASDRSLMLYLAADVSISQVIKQLERQALPGITTMSPGCSSVLLRFDPLVIDHATLESRLAIQNSDADDTEIHTLKVPVCYAPQFAPDLEEVAATNHLTPAQVVELHSGVTYRVGFLGFLPGFAYMSELPESIATQRKPTPRRKVASGTVAIAGRQTGIYPNATPGGWNLIGCCPLRIFDPAREPASLFALGDEVRFHPISVEEFSQTQRQLE